MKQNKSQLTNTRKKDLERLGGAQNPKPKTRILFSYTPPNPKESKAILISITNSFFIFSVRKAFGKSNEN
jgi:hypothetical protein